MRLFLAGLLTVLFSMAPSASLFAAVTRIEIKTREPYAEGRVFDGIGAYEKVRGTVFFAVDPKLAANQQVIDIDLAPKNEAGLVEFSADVEWLAPKDLAKGYSWGATILRWSM